MKKLFFITALLIKINLNIDYLQAQTWSAVGTGVTGGFNPPQVIALCVFNSSLYAGGTFDSAGVYLANHIARWDGSDWLNARTGVMKNGNVTVLALDVYNFKLYVGGYFFTADSILCNYIASWDGAN